MEFVTEQDFRAAWSVFRARRDKGWSFTDCVSQVVMQRLGIRHAFTFDEHFRQFGTVATLPSWTIRGRSEAHPPGDLKEFDQTSFLRSLGLDEAKK